jgi:uncharacterized protein YegL
MYKVILKEVASGRKCCNVKTQIGKPSKFGNTSKEPIELAQISVGRTDTQENVEMAPKASKEVTEIEEITEIEFAENRESRLAVVLILDASSSMAGEPIKELNEGIKIFKEELLKDTQARLSVEIEIVVVSGEEAIVVQEFVTVDNFFPEPLKPVGRTPMGGGIELAMQELAGRKDSYKRNDISYFRPWLIIISDGQPTDEWKIPATKLKEAEERGELICYPVAVKKAEISILSQMSANPVVKLNGLQFKEMFKWLSASVTEVSRTGVGNAVELPAVSWGNVTEE